MSQTSLNGSHSSVRISHNVGTSAASARKKNIVRNLGMCEIMVGTVCLITGIVVVVIAKTSDSEGYRTIGEGIWAPIFGILAGVFGAMAGGKKSTGAKVNAHLGTGIIAALFAFILMCIDSRYSLESDESEDQQRKKNQIYSYGVLGLAILSFINFVLLVVSTTYACCMLEGCICCCDIERRDGYGGAVDFSQHKMKKPFRGPVSHQPR